MKTSTAIFFLFAVLGGLDTARAKRMYTMPNMPCCEYGPCDAIVWSGTDSLMTLEQLAAYCGPILWFSPDEPLLHGATGRDIRIPAAFPFETAPDAPVVYFRVRSVLKMRDYAGEAFIPDPNDRGRGVLNLKAIAGMDLDYFFYYPSEEGFGGHQHDVESTELKVGVWKRPGCLACPLSIVVGTVNCKAHGVQWYDNTLDVDADTRFPMTVLVEEGKHAGCTDKNGDGYYTPGYDVNRRVNDAWGVRDIIRGGGLFAGSFQSWFAKVRTKEHRIFPPLPKDSAVRDRFTKNGMYAADYAQYQLRPFPCPGLAAADPKLVPFIADKGDTTWPAVAASRDIAAMSNWLGKESFLKSVNVSMRMDGRAGVAVVFPLFGFWHFSDPVGGGWIVNRMYLMDDNLRDFGWNFLYTSSASRWLDAYFSVGYEKDENDLGDARRYWVAESGFKFRADILHSRLSFMSKLTDFWGIRIGMQAAGLMPVERFRYVVEIGAGAF